METLTVEGTAIFGLTPHSRILFVHAHPDDETVASGEAITQAVEVGSEVHVAVATFGGETTLKHADPDHPWTKNQDIKSVRAAEITRALDQMGIKKANQHFYDLPDGKLPKRLHKTRLALHIAGTILKNHITHVVTPGAEGFDKHPDHIATHQATMLAIRLLRMVGVRPAVFASNAHGKGNIVVPVDAAKKLHILRQHYSQFPMWTASDTPNRNGLVAVKTEYGLYIPQETVDYLAHYTNLIYERETYDQLY